MTSYLLSFGSHTNISKYFILSLTDYKVAEDHVMTREKSCILPLHIKYWIYTLKKRYFPAASVRWSVGLAWFFCGDADLSTLTFSAVERSQHNYNLTLECISHWSRSFKLHRHVLRNCSRELVFPLKCKMPHFSSFCTKTQLTVFITLLQSLQGNDSKGINIHGIQNSF